MTVKNLMRMVGFKGAGVVFAAPDENGETRVLLGQRSFRPYRGYWSLPGGGMELSDNGNFRACAAREAFEETVGDQILTELRGVFENQLSNAREHQLRLRPFFEFRSYLLRLSDIPDERLWPNRQLWGNEFEQFNWFKPHKLPEPLHPHLAKTLKALLAPM